MKNIVFILFLVGMMSNSSCSKNNSLSPDKEKRYVISFVPTIKNGADWQHIFGGKAVIEFIPKNNDTVSISSLKDSLDFQPNTDYRQHLLAGKYDVILKTTSTAVADTFVRFSAHVKDVEIKGDQQIELAAITTDGLISISKADVQPLTVPTFLPQDSTNAMKLGLANGYYFIYANKAVKGRITFTEATTGDLFMADITVEALTHYNFIPKLSASRSLVISSRSLK